MGRRCVGGARAGDRHAGVAGRGQRRPLRRVRLIDRLIERVVVDVAVERLRPDRAEVGIPRQRQRGTQVLAPGGVQERAVLAHVIDALPVGAEAFEVRHVRALR